MPDRPRGVFTALPGPQDVIHRRLGRSGRHRDNDMIACPKCGWELTPGARACRRCGAEVPGAGAPHVSGAERPAGADAADDPVRSQLQRFVASLYAVEQPLGRGPTTAVYKGSELNPPRPVALKVLPPGLGVGPAATRFKDEARKAMALNHPNIVPIYRVGLKGGAPYFIATKLVDGRSLQEILESQGALALPALLVVLRVVTEALNYAHGRGTVHGHLKAANVLVDRTGQVMVADFGISRAIEGVTAGGGGGASPIALPGGEGAAGDQFALGLVALHMLGGTEPRAADPIVALREVAAARSTVPQGLVRIVETALAPDAGRRYASTSDMLAAIKGVPVSDADRREGTNVLGQLARGEAVPKLRVAPAPRTEVRPAAKAAAATQVRPAAQAASQKPAAATPTAAAPAAKPAPPTPKAEPPRPAPQAAPPAPAARPAPSPPAPPAPMPPAAPATPAQAEPLELASPTAWMDAGPAAAKPTPAPPPPPAAPRHAPTAAAAFAMPPEPEPEPEHEPEPPPREPVSEAPPSRRSSGARSSLEAGAAASERPLMRRSRPTPSFQGILAQPERERRSPVGMIAAIVVLLAALGGGAWFLFLRKPAAAPLAQAPATPARPAPTAPAAPTAAESLRADSAPRARPRPAAAAADTNAPAATTGQILLSVTAASAQILVDGVESGSDGFLDSEVTAGRRELQISAPGYETLDTTINVRAGRTVDLGTISLPRATPAGPPRGWLWLTVTPSSAAILVDGQRSGTGTLTQFEVTAGLRRLQLSAPGYATLDTMVSVDAGDQLHLGPFTLRSAPGR